MSLSAELKDFSNSFRSTTDMWTRYSREKDMAAYRKAKLTDSQTSGGFGGDVPGGSGSGASGGASGGTKLSQADQQATARKIYSSLLDKGYTSTAAAGITGNLWHESGGFGGGAGDSGSAHGIAQWRGDRWTKLQEFAKAKGKDPNDLNTQVDYLDQELKTDYKSAYNLLQHASDVKTATGIFADQYEKPAGSGKGNYGGISGMSNRLNFATQVSNFGGGAIGTKPVTARAVTRAVTGPQASLGSAPSNVAPTQTAMGAPPVETELGSDTTSSATDTSNQFASADEQPSDEDAQAAARGGLIRSYAAGGKVEPDFENVDKGLDTNFNPAFRKSLLNLQQQATAAGIKTKLISGVRTLQDQKELYANKLAGDAGKPLPYPKRGPVKVAAVPGTSPHEKGMAADLVAVNPKDQPKIDALAAKDPNLGTVAGDPGHYQLNTGGKGGGTMVASGKVPSPPTPPSEEEANDPALEEPADSGDQPEQREQSGAQAMADATERGRANQAYMASEERYGLTRLMQEGQANEQALGQEAAARSTPPPPQQAQPEQAEGAARGGRIRAYAPGGVVDATGYIAPDTATLSASTQALAPAVQAASQATPAVPTTTAAPAPAVATAAPAPAPAPAAAAAPRYDPNTPWGILQAGGVSQENIAKAIAASGSPSPRTTTVDTGGFGGVQRYTAYDPKFSQQAPEQAAPAPAPPPVTGTDRGSVWNPATKSWEAGAGYVYDQGTKSWKPGAKAAAGGGMIRGYADGGDVDDDADGAVSTAPAPAPVPAPAPAPVQPTPTGDARTRGGAPGTTDVGAGAPQPGQKPPPPPPNLVADALHDGLMHLTKMFGLDKLGAVQDPDAAARVQAFNNGAGAADGDAMHAVHRAVDPNNQMTQQELATASVAALKSYYDAKGQPEAGAKAIGEIMQHQKAVSAHFSATAAQAFQQGDVANGLKFLKASYDQVPDGQHIDAQIQQDGTVAYRLTDSHSGRVIHQGVANAQQLARLAQVGATGTPYVKAVATTAARAKTPTVPPGTQSKASLEANPPMPPLQRPPGAVDATQQGPESPNMPPDSSVYTGNKGFQPSDMPSSGVGASAADQPAPGPTSQAEPPAGGSGAYLAHREAALTSGVSPGAVDTGGTRVAQADTGTRTDATVDGAKATAITPEAKAAARAAIGGGDEPAPAEAPPKIAPAPAGRPVGLVAPGNIDLAHRPVAKTEDGRSATVRSIGIGVDGKEVLIPTVIDGKIVSEAEAKEHYRQTGENLGTFDTVANAEKYARELHMAQADFYRSGGPPPAEAVDTGKITPTKVDERPIPEELTKPVVPTREKADQADVPEVAPVTPKSVDDQYDLTPRTFDKPPPNPDDYFQKYNYWKDKAKTTGDRKALVTMYSQANTAYREADAAWKDEKSVFETEEGKRLTAANEQAGRAQTRENTTSSEQFDIDKEKRKEVLTANEKAQERKDKDADTLAAQQAGLNKDEVARIVERNKEDRAAARAGDERAQARLDKTADDLTARQDAIDKEYRAHTWEGDKEARALAEANRKEAEIKPPTSDEQKAIDEKLAEAPKDGTSPLDDMYASFLDPDTGEKYKDPAKMKNDLGASTVNGIRELVGHLIHANGMTPATAVDITKQLVNSDLDAPSETDDQSYYPGRRDRQPQEFFKVAPKPDKAGNPIIKVPGYAPFRISPEMSSSVLDMQKSIREHSAKVRGWATSRDALEKVRGDVRSGTVGGAVDASVQAGKNILFPTKPVTGNEPIVPSASKPKRFGTPKFEYVPGDKITPEMRAAYPKNYFGNQ